ncbi:hypothetical protein D3C74_319250 [compost metagenome]
MHTGLHPADYFIPILIAEVHFIQNHRFKLLYNITVFIGNFAYKMRFHTFSSVCQSRCILSKLHRRIFTLLSKRGIYQPRKHGFRFSCIFQLTPILFWKINFCFYTEAELLHVLIPYFNTFRLIFVIQPFSNHINHKSIRGYTNRFRRIKLTIHMA